MSNEIIQALVDALDELGEGLKCAEPGAARSILHASAAVTRAKMLAEPQWGEPTSDDWYWCEELENETTMVDHARRRQDLPGDV